MRLLFLEFGDRKSMQRSHLQWSSEMPQNPTGEQQGSPLLGSHSATGPPSHARLGNPHLPVLLILIPAMFKGQLISKCSFGVKTSSKKPTKFFPGFLP